MNDNKGELIIYQTEDGLTKIDVRMDNETACLTSTTNKKSIAIKRHYPTTEGRSSSL